jgi:hypothetical protein
MRLPVKSLDIDIQGVFIWILKCRYKNRKFRGISDIDEFKTGGLLCVFSGCS